MWNVQLSQLSFRMSVKVTPKKIVSYLEKYGQTEKNNLAFVSPETVRAACVQLPKIQFDSLQEYLSEMLAQVSNAVNAGAQLIVFPEYTGLLPCTLIPGFEHLAQWAADGKLPADFTLLTPNPRRLNALIEAFHNFIFETYFYTFATIARLQRVYIAAGSVLLFERGRLYHRCVLFGPDGEPIGWQDQLSADRFSHSLGVQEADDISLFDTPLGKLAILPGNDAYYFEYFKIAALRGATIIASPCMQSRTVAELLRSRAAAHNLIALYSGLPIPDGRDAPCAGIYAPSQLMPGREGILSEPASAGGCACARLNLTKLADRPFETEPNPAFLRGDYLHSYRYGGALPLVNPEKA